MVCERSDVLASACAIARAFPLFTRKSNSNQSKRKVIVEYLLVGAASDSHLTEAELQCLTDAADGVRLAARITDTPCAEMHTDIFIDVRASSLILNSSLIGLKYYTISYSDSEVIIA